MIFWFTVVRLHSNNNDLFYLKVCKRFISTQTYIIKTNCNEHTILE